MRFAPMMIGIMTLSGLAVALFSGGSTAWFWALVLCLGSPVVLAVGALLRPSRDYWSFQRDTLPVTPAQAFGLSDTPSTRSGFVGGGISTPVSFSNPNLP